MKTDLVFGSLTGVARFVYALPLKKVWPIFTEAAKIDNKLLEIYHTAQNR